MESLDLLAAYGIPIARGGLARSADEAAALAQDLGEGVVLKVVAPEIVHKSDVGGVRIGVPAQEVRGAYQEMVGFAPAVGVYVQELLPPGQEVIVGIVRDPTFGALVMFGLGGVFVEALGDVAFALAPSPRRRRRSSCGASAPSPPGRDTREAPVHLAGLVAAVERISHLAVEFPEIAELDVNPILCYPDRIVAVDLRVTVSGAEGLPRGRGQP